MNIFELKKHFKEECDLNNICHLCEIPFKSKDNVRIHLKYDCSEVQFLCEKCGKDVSSEVHHLQHQKDADEHGMIHSSGTPFHKNHSANLLNLCKKCHDEFHDTPITHKKTKTTRGVSVKPVKN